MSVIGIDIDGTLAAHCAFVAPDVIGEPNPVMVRVIRTLVDEGHLLCAWTCRADYVTEKWLKQHNLRQYFKYINQSPYITDSLKASFDVYIGDEAVTSLRDDHIDILNEVRFRLATTSNLGLNDLARDHNFSSHAPVPFLAGTGRMYIDMFEQAWRDAWENQPYDKSRTIALLTICSHAKPYSKSFIHAVIRKKLYEIGMLNAIQYAHISTAGIIPSSAEMTYPFNAYDHDGSQMTDEAKEHFSETTYLRICRWLSHYGGDYKKIVFYLRGEGKTHTAAVKAVDSVRMIDVTIVGAEIGDEHYLPFAALRDVDDCLTSDTNLNKLVNALKDNP